MVTEKSALSYRQLLTWGLVAVNLYLLPSAVALAHGIPSRALNFRQQRMDWHTEQISRVMSYNGEDGGGRVITLDGEECLVGKSFSFDVKDGYAFDIDETVRVEVEFYQGLDAVDPVLSYEKNGEAKAAVRAKIRAYKGGSRSQKVTFVLERARFANRQFSRTDFEIATGEPGWPQHGKLTICNISLTRSYTTAVLKEWGNVTVEVRDETGKAVPARVGVYDDTGRLPLPSEEAIAVKRADEAVRIVHLNPLIIPWPARNPSGFYINGSYHAKLPAGQYELVVAKGPEYRFGRHKFTVRRDRTQTVRVDLKRWDNLPARGWYSGDNHIHYIRRGENDDPNLLLFTEAEDLHVANILQMGNVAAATWPQYGWRSVTAVADDTYAFVPGQEDPRTAQRGHTISLRLTEPIRNPEHYLLYHEVFEKARAQGGVTGYAHVIGAGNFNARGGLALDVPFGLVDFVEVMQFGMGGSDIWFDFMNLGYKLAPSAGTDYAIDVTLPGAERSYVYVPRPFSLQGWFDALKRGESFVTNGPMLEFTVNNKRSGSEMHLKSGEKLTIEATASINPDIDFLDSVELIEQGEVVKAVKAEGDSQTRLRLHYETAAHHGTWFVIRAKGKRPFGPPLFSAIEALDARQGSAKIALSGAIYINVGGQGFWKPAAVPEIVRRLKKSMADVMVPDTGVQADPGTREAAVTYWDGQKDLLKQRIDKVTSIYDDLVAKAKMATESRLSHMGETDVEHIPIRHGP